MSKQVLTPRFYVDIPSFIHAMGYAKYFDNNVGGQRLLYMNPSSQWLRQLPHPDSWNSQWYTLHSIGRVVKSRTVYGINFCALINHNYGVLCGESPAMDSDILFYAKRYDAGSDNANKSNRFNNYVNVLNSGDVSGDAYYTATRLKPNHNGTSIFTFDETYGIWNSFSTSITQGNENSTFPNKIGLDTLGGHFIDNDVSGMGLGAMVVGKYWDAPNSPDLKLTMRRRFDGIKKQNTVGGKTISNIYYDGPQEWTMHGIKDYSPNWKNNIHQYPPFELSSATPSGVDDIFGDGNLEEVGETYYKHRAKSGFGRKGLRTWDLSFSYITDDDMWMAYENSSVAPFTSSDNGTNTTTNSTIPSDGDHRMDEYDATWDEARVNPMFTDNSFNFVWNMTLGGSLPFLFQPDNTNSNPDQFAICTFRGDTLSVKQVASNVYTLKVTIDEVA
jgi:hypothetical protein